MKKKPQKQEMPFLEHLEELRWRLIRILIALGAGMLLCFIFADRILVLLTHPAAQMNPPLHFQFLKVQGMFMVYLEIGFFGGLVLSLPYALVQIWGFVSPGLMNTERRYLLPMILSSTFLFLVGLSFAYWIMVPFALDFFVGLAPQGIEANIAIDFYIGFLIRLMLIFGVVFELPVISYFLGKVGFITSAVMRKYRRHAIVVIFFVAAVLTPPDPMTQIMLGVPLVLLYELSIYIVIMVEKANKRREKEASDSAAVSGWEPGFPQGEGVDS